jgi:hypothetical protein
LHRKWIGCGDTNNSWTRRLTLCEIDYPSDKKRPQSSKPNTIWVNRKETNRRAILTDNRLLMASRTGNVDQLGRNKTLSLIRVAITLCHDVLKMELVFKVSD